MTSSYRVGIMGAGRIAQRLDRRGSPRVLTLAHAIVRSPGLVLGGFYDLDPEHAREGEWTWSCPASPRDRSAWLAEQWEIICIATPDAEHARDLRDALERRPRAILVEKPVATDPLEATALVRRAQSEGIPLIVNYPRRYHSGVARATELIRSDALGRPIRCVFVYSGSAVHSAVHMLDLFVEWWGHDWRIAETRRRAGSIALQGAGATEVRLTFEAIPTANYYVWELHGYCSAGKIEVSHSPEMLSVYRLGKHRDYEGFRVLERAFDSDMEAEPLLERVMSRLTRIASDPAEASIQSRREVEGQTFTSAVLNALS